MGRLSIQDLSDPFGSRACLTSVVSTGGKYIYEDDQETPNTQIATFDFGDAELVFEVRGLPTGSEGNISQTGNTVGDLFYGSEGWMANGRSGFQVYKGEKSEKIMDEGAERSTEGCAWRERQTLPQFLPGNA